MTGDFEVGTGPAAKQALQVGNLENAEKPSELIVYGGTGKAARNWECYEKIVKSLKELDCDETLLIQSGKPVGIFKTFENSPRVIIANSNLVPAWSNWGVFNDLEKQGLIMYGQMTAGSWCYIGTQGIIQGTYETFAALAKKHFGGTLKGRLVLVRLIIFAAMTALIVIGIATIESVGYEFIE